ncbi:MAG: transcription antitermination factor NusB [Elusimicrobiota bacterium]|jgi:transcription antitermination factor NusB|nr:transcription antitermination factor NusB [Elusimicrobiota bacterium]
MLTRRRQARTCSLQMLYAFDNCKMPAEEVINFFRSRFPSGENYKSFMLTLFNGVCLNQIEIDALIKKYAKNWEIDRMAAVDRNIIRIAVYEIIKMPETPINVIIDEAVEISKKYSTDDSSKFVNGILDKIKLVREIK